MMLDLLTVNQGTFWNPNQVFCAWLGSPLQLNLDEKNENWNPKCGSFLSTVIQNVHVFAAQRRVPSSRNASTCNLTQKINKNKNKNISPHLHWLYIFIVCSFTSAWQGYYDTYWDYLCDRSDTRKLAAQDPRMCLPGRRYVAEISIDVLWVLFDFGPMRSYLPDTRAG